MMRIRLFCELKNVNEMLTKSKNVSKMFTEKILAMNLVRCYNVKRKNYDLRNGDRIYHEKTTFIGLLLMFVLVAVGCAPSNSNSKTQSGKLKISTTFFPIYDFTRNIVGDEGDVTLVIGAGTEPHDYEPSAKEIAK